MTYDALEKHADKLEEEIDALTGSMRRLRKERDALYWHCNALVELLIQLNKAPVATYAAAYLTQIVPPKMSIAEEAKLAAAEIISKEIEESGNG